MFGTTSDGRRKHLISQKHNDSSLGANVTTLAEQSEQSRQSQLLFIDDGKSCEHHWGYWNKGAWLRSPRTLLSVAYLQSVGTLSSFFPAFLLGNTSVKVTGKGRAPASALLGCFHGLENSRVPLVPNRGNGGKSEVKRSFKCWKTTKQSKTFHWKQNGLIPVFASQTMFNFFFFFWPETQLYLISSYSNISM